MSDLPLPDQDFFDACRDGYEGHVIWMLKDIARFDLERTFTFSLGPRVVSCVFHPFTFHVHFSFFLLSLCFLVC